MAKFCTNCGKEVNEGADICLNCGKRINAEDKNNVFLMLVSFLVPLIGLILYLSYKKTTPIRAKGIGIAALVGMLINISSVIFN